MVVLLVYLLPHNCDTGGILLALFIVCDGHGSGGSCKRGSALPTRSTIITHQT